MHKHNNCGCAPTTTLWDQSWFNDGAAAVRETTHKSHYHSYRPAQYGVPEDAGRQWHVYLQDRFALHPVVKAMLEHRPRDWHTLLLEWPHVSEKDAKQLAYTRDEGKGTADVQTLTSIGKYVARHWPHVSDHLRRDACALYTPDRMMFLPANVDEFVNAACSGPKSCMSNRFTPHPYRVYEPKFGWGMAVRMSDSALTAAQIDGRAITWTDPDNAERKLYARSYKRHETDVNGYSEADTVLESWLHSQGYVRSAWPEGALLAYVEGYYGNHIVLPYIDGDNDTLSRTTRNGESVLVFDDSGSIKGDSTGGTASGGDGDEDEDTFIGNCEHCSDSIHEGDDYSHVGRHEDQMTCSHCVNHHYTYVEGVNNRGRSIEYYVADDDVVYVNDAGYDSNNLPDNIVQLENGDYLDTDTDDYCIIDDEYYLSDDERVVCCEDVEYRLRDDCWECIHSGKWYSDDDTDDQVEVDGDTYHRDSLSDILASKQVAPLFPEMATA